MTGHAAMDDSDGDIEIGTGESESEGPVVTTKEALRAFTILRYCDTRGCDERRCQPALYSEGPAKASIKLREAK